MHAIFNSNTLTKQQIQIHTVTGKLHVTLTKLSVQLPEKWCAINTCVSLCFDVQSAPKN